MVKRLWVFLSGQRVGMLDEQDGNLLFTYEAEAQAALSVNLPLRAEPYDNALCRPFFDNLLPEGSWRQSLCRQLRIDERNDFQLLAAIGTECAGAVSLHADPDWTPRRLQPKSLPTASISCNAFGPFPIKVAPFIG
jgi:serine/threonine-protein kinase HipA